MTVSTLSLSSSYDKVFTSYTNGIIVYILYILQTSRLYTTLPQHSTLAFTTICSCWKGQRWWLVKVNHTSELLIRCLCCQACNHSWQCTSAPILGCWSRQFQHPYPSGLTEWRLSTTVSLMSCGKLQSDLEWTIRGWTLNQASKWFRMDHTGLDHYPSFKVIFFIFIFS